ncbi:uncharacterized protein LOC130773499 isoform X1 [Actinidia eriantha]|uniref:uncharacterized protein LOC130773499 isoform X1 n=1 Tax=Actinidia eriantha TaxID=165200 RepID=UPI002582EA8E|nr:uncharacterized protein LOC130773499 isoform X1 [Actinidia eriantha]XP_057487420.1 uncharacterized protein LOC130773499 isoform X1 [Actinidia eriantha]
MDLLYNKAKMKPKIRAQEWREKVNPMNLKNQRNPGESGNFCIVKVNEVGNGWLYRSAIAKISSTKSIVRIQDQLRNLGQEHVLVRHMGGDMVVLTFKDLEERESMFNEGKMAWLKDWFVESSKWESTKSNPCSRLVWLNCYGIPLHLWNLQTFSEIGKIWGEIIMIAEETLKNLSFAVGKVLISTTVMDSIKKTVELDNNGSLTQIRVMEEQLVMNTVLRTDCACPGCLMEPPSLNQTLDETSTQPPIRTVNGGDASPKFPLIEEVAESVNHPLEVVPSLLGPCPTKADETPCLVNINSMQLVPFTGSSGCEHTTRGSRLGDNSSEKGRGASNSYLEALMSNLGLPKLSNDPTKLNILTPLTLPEYLSNGPQKIMNIATHKKQINASLKINTIIPLIPNHIPHNPGNSLLSTGPRKKPPNDPIQEPNLPSIPVMIEEKPKRKQRSIEDILGLPKHIKTKKSGRRGKQKCVVFRSAMAAAAFSVSAEGITNRNRILISEAKAAWNVTRILRTDYMGNDEDVISRIMVTDEEAELGDVLVSQSK